MSLKTIYNCDICDEEFNGMQADRSLDIGFGVGLVFRSVKRGDFIFGKPHDTNGIHICNICAQTLHRELTEYFK